MTGSRGPRRSGRQDVDAPISSAQIPHHYENAILIGRQIAAVDNSPPPDREIQVGGLDPELSGRGRRSCAV